MSQGNQFCSPSLIKNVKRDENSEIHFNDLYFIRQTAVSANDGQWHHICLTWESSAGSWKMYKDGKVAASGKGFKTGIFFLLRL